jgi:ribonuclease P protein component
MLTFNSKQKIKKKSEIQYLLRNGNRVSRESFAIFFKKNSLNNDRLGVLVSRKVGNAIVRNKIKRIFREIFRTEILRDPPFYDILIQTRPGIKIINKSKFKICFREWIIKSKTN